MTDENKRIMDEIREYLEAKEHQDEKDSDLMTEEKN